jgi:hypothetical protein
LWFLPYVHPISAEEQRRLTKAAESFVERKVNDKEFGVRLAKALQSRTARRKIKNMYDREEFGDANAISFSLYMGPRTKSTDRRVVQSTMLKNDLDTPGWLLTGDAKLRNCDRRDEWMKFLTQKHSLPIGTLMLPHHGSVLTVLGACSTPAILRRRENWHRNWHRTSRDS